MSDEPRTATLGAVVSVRGSVVDIRFDEHLPPIYSVLRAGDEGQIVIEVLARPDSRHVRGIALTPTQGLVRGMAVEDTGGPLKVPVGKGIVSRMFDVFGNAYRRTSLARGSGRTPQADEEFAPGRRWRHRRQLNHAGATLVEDGGGTTTATPGPEPTAS